MAHRPAMEGVNNCKRCEREAEEDYYKAEKEAMLKHITDLEAALKRVVTICEYSLTLSSANEQLDIELMAEAIKQQFAYLFDLDDGYEPPEHMTADDFNEMHSGPYQPDDTGYSMFGRVFSFMDGDE